MDPYSAEGELVNIHNAFHQGQYKQVTEIDTSSFSKSNDLPVKILKLRALLALGQYDDAIAQVKGQEKTPDYAAVRILAEYKKNPANAEKAAQAAAKLAADSSDNLTVQLLAGTVLADVGQTEEALALLSKHQGSLDAVALITQIHLQQNRTDLALKEAQKARKWAQDSLLVNLVESWVGLREGGEKYQQSYYVFEELAQAPATQAVHTLVGQAVAELHLGRIEESQAALQQAQDMEAQNPNVIANTIVLNTISGQDTSALVASLESAEPKHMFLQDLAAKKEAFDAACAKYTPKFEV